MAGVPLPAAREPLTRDLEEEGGKQAWSVLSVDPLAFDSMSLVCFHTHRRGLLAVRGVSDAIALRGIVSLRVTGWPIKKHKFQLGPARTVLRWTSNFAATYQLTAGVCECIEIERRGLLSPHRLPGPQGPSNFLALLRIVCALQTVRRPSISMLAFWSARPRSSSERFTAPSPRRPPGPVVLSQPPGL